MHAEGHFVGADAGSDLGVVDEFVSLGVELLDGFNERALVLAIDPAGIGDVLNGVAGGVEFDSLEAGREESGSPLSRRDGLGIAATDGGEDNETRKVFRFRAEAVVDPGSHGRATADGGAGVHEGVGRIVIDLLGHHGANDGDIVRHLLVVGHVVRDVLSGLSVFFKFAEVAEDFELLTLKLRNGLSFGEGLGHGLSVEFIELGFVVEGLEV